MKKTVCLSLLLYAFSLANAQKRFGFYGGMNLSPAPVYGKSYLQKANTEFRNLVELRPHFGTPVEDKAFMHKHLAFWYGLRPRGRMSYRAELGLISFGYKETRILPPNFASYPWGYSFLPPGDVVMNYTHYAHYMYIGPSASIWAWNKLYVDVGLFYWFQDAEKKYVNLSNTYSVEASVLNDPDEKTIFTRKILNPDSRSGGLMGRLGISYNFEPNLRIHLLFNHFLTPANKRTDWGRIYHRSLGIGLSYEFGKKVKNTK